MCFLVLECPIATDNCFDRQRSEGQSLGVFFSSTWLSYFTWPQLFWQTKKRGTTSRCFLYYLSVLLQLTTTVLTDKEAREITRWFCITWLSYCNWQLFWQTKKRGTIIRCYPVLDCPIANDHNCFDRQRSEGQSLGGFFLLLDCPIATDHNCFDRQRSEGQPLGVFCITWVSYCNWQLFWQTKTRRTITRCFLYYLTVLFQMTTTVLTDKEARDNH